MNANMDSPQGHAARNRRWLPSCFRRLRGNRGVTMVEFAIVIVPFLMLVFGTFEIGFILWGTYELENATEDAAREIRTGQYTGAMGKDGFKARVCAKAVLLTQCGTKLRLDVRSFADFSGIAANPPQPLDGDGNLQDDGTWNPGGSRSIVVVSTFYQWPLFDGLSGLFLSNMAGGDRLIWAAAAFRNESW